MNEEKISEVKEKSLLKVIDAAIIYLKVVTSMLEELKEPKDTKIV